MSSVCYIQWSMDLKYHATTLNRNKDFYDKVHLNWKSLVLPQRAPQIKT